MKHVRKTIFHVSDHKNVLAFVLLFGLTGCYFILRSFAATPACNLNATTANFAAQVSAATAGQTICLATGNYGTWAGTNKAVIITEQSGATATMAFDLGLGDANFTIDGLTIPDGNISGDSNNYSNANNPKNITVQNSAFTGNVNIEYISNANIVFDNNTHININSCESCRPAALQLSYGSNIFSGVTVKNSLFQGGNADGIQAGTGLNIINNRFIDISEHGNDALHTDPIQLIGAKGSVVRGNYLYNTSDGIVAYDGIDSALIEDNVVDLVSGRWGIELYSDKNSVVRHNTLKYGTGCGYAPCGMIILDHKSADPAGSGTQIYDNIATEISYTNGSTSSRRDHNLVRQSAQTGDFTGTPTYTGGANPTNFIGFLLTANSPGHLAASDGTDIGANVTGAAPPADTTPPDTTITVQPASSTTATTASFSFSSTESGSTFECKLDSGSYAACTSPKSLTGLSVANHTFSVRATDSSGNTDASADTYTWAVTAAGAPVVGDFNADGHVNIFDLGIFLSHYGQNNATYDLNNDVNHAVNVFDLGIFLTNYGT